MEHVWAKIKQYLDNRFGAGIYNNTNYFSNKARVSFGPGQIEITDLNLNFNGFYLNVDGTNVFEFRFQQVTPGININKLHGCIINFDMSQTMKGMIFTNNTETTIKLNILYKDSSNNIKCSSGLGFAGYNDWSNEPLNGVVLMLSW